MLKNMGKGGIGNVDGRRAGCNARDQRASNEWRESPPPRSPYSKEMPLTETSSFSAKLTPAAA